MNNRNIKSFNKSFEKESLYRKHIIKTATVIIIPSEKTTTSFGKTFKHNEIIIQELQPSD